MAPSIQPTRTSPRFVFPVWRAWGNVSLPPISFSPNRRRKKCLRWSSMMIHPFRQLILYMKGQYRYFPTSFWVPYYSFYHLFPNGRRSDEDPLNYTSATNANVTFRSKLQRFGIPEVSTELWIIWAWINESNSKEIVLYLCLKVESRYFSLLIFIALRVIFERITIFPPCLHCQTSLLWIIK